MSDGPDGFVVIDKPAGWTSHDVVAKSRGVLGTRRVGHSGTLDPPATGVLVLGVGRATRLLRFVTALPKRYLATVALGVETSTLDAEGEVVASHEMTVTESDIRRVTRQFVGEIEQIPPMVSAVKVGGRRLHEIARQGEVVERQPRSVVIHELEVSEVDLDDMTFRLGVRCSSGTYVRTLAADIGAGLGGGAHLRSLVRTEIGSLGLDEAHSVEDPVLLAPAAGLRDYPHITVNETLAAAVGHGRALPREEVDVAGPGPWVVRDGAGRMLAMYEANGPAEIKPAVVIV